MNAARKEASRANVSMAGHSNGSMYLSKGSDLKLLEVFPRSLLIGAETACVWVQRFMPTVPTRRKKAAPAAAGGAGNLGMDDKSFQALLTQVRMSAENEQRNEHVNEWFFSNNTHRHGLKR